MSEKIRIGILGAGYMSRIHAKAMVAAGHDVVVVSDVSSDAAAEFSETFGCRVAADQDAFFEEGLDLVSIVLPNHLHCQAALAAIEAGRAVLCEKPMTGSASQSEKIVTKLTEHRTPFFVGYMKRLHPAAKRFQEFAQQIGRPRSGLVRAYHPVSSGTWDWFKSKLQSDPSRPLDGMLVNGGSHMIDLLLWAAGPMTDVLAGRMQFHDDLPTFDVSTHAMLEMASGMTVQLDVGNLPLHGVGKNENGWDEFIELRGEEGLARLYTPRWNMASDEPAIAELWHEPSKSWERYNCGPADYYTREFEWIGDALRGGEVPLATAEDGLAVDRVLDAIRNCSCALPAEKKT